MVFKRSNVYRSKKSHGDELIGYKDVSLLDDTTTLDSGHFFGEKFSNPSFL